MAEWTRYGCEISAAKRLRSDDCVALKDVYHVVHVSDARRIIEDGKVKARLIYDESKLNKTRMHVCWVSANYWSTGSIYGSVSFNFRWANLVKNKRVYWVEAMPAYRPHAYRFLLTNRDPSTLQHVTAYDPETADGPLRKCGNAWFWNGNYTAEFMIDEEIPLKLCKKLEFIPHHRAICRLFKSSCKERDQDWTETSAQLLGYLIGTGTKDVNDALTPDVGRPDGKRAMIMVEGGLGRLWVILGGGKSRSFVGPVNSMESAMLIARSALLQYGFGNISDARNLTFMLSSYELFERAMERLVQEHFNMPDYKFA